MARTEQPPKTVECPDCGGIASFVRPSYLFGRVFHKRCWVYECAVCARRFVTDLSPISNPKYNAYLKLWNESPSPAFWCERYQHVLHRQCPVVLNYEHMPEPFKSCANKKHEGKTGDTVHVTAQICCYCKLMVRNGGICDPC